MVLAWQLSMLEDANRLGEVTDRTFIQGACVSLQVDELDGVARLAAFYLQVGSLAV